MQRERRQNLCLLNPKGGFRQVRKAGINVDNHDRVPKHAAGLDGGYRATGGKYGANLTIFSLGFKEFLATVKSGRVQKQMPPWKDVLDENAIRRIGAYLETLAQPGANWQ